MCGYPSIRSARFPNSKNQRIKNTCNRFSEFQYQCGIGLLSLGRSKTVKFAARHTQDYDSLQINGCFDAEPLGRSNRSRPSHFG